MFIFCPHCFFEKPEVQFTFISNQPFLTICKQCRKEQQLVYRVKYLPILSTRYHKDLVNASRRKLLKGKKYTIRRSIKSRIAHILKARGLVKNRTYEEIIGCSPSFLCEYLEQSFEKNYGRKRGKEEAVHLDHIIPISKAETEEEIYKLSHYTNLQYLLPEDNQEKSNRLDWMLDSKS